MKQFLAITKALSDESRVRALMMLRGGELCVCQIIDALNLAPSTVSRHMTMLYDAGLVERRKQGKWHFYRLPDCCEQPAAGEALAWVRKALEADPSLVGDQRTLETVKGKQLQEVCACYRN